MLKASDSKMLSDQFVRLATGTERCSSPTSDYTLSNFGVSYSNFSEILNFLVLEYGLRGISLEKHGRSKKSTQKTVCSLIAMSTH